MCGRKVGWIKPSCPRTKGGGQDGGDREKSGRYQRPHVTGAPAKPSCRRSFYLVVFRPVHVRVEHVCRCVCQQLERPEVRERGLCKDDHIRQYPSIRSSASRFPSRADLDSGGNTYTSGLQPRTPLPNAPLLHLKQLSRASAPTTGRTYYFVCVCPTLYVMVELRPATIPRLGLSIALSVMDRESLSHHETVPVPPAWVGVTASSPTVLRASAKAAGATFSTPCRVGPVGRGSPHDHGADSAVTEPTKLWRRGGTCTVIRVERFGGIELR